MSIAQILNKSRSITPLEQTALEKIGHCSPYLTRLLSKDEDLLDDLLQNHQLPYLLVEMQRFLDNADIETEKDFKKVLRHLRQHVLARIIWRDLNGLADFKEVVDTISTFADWAINTTVAYVADQLQKTYGQPLDESGKMQPFIVIGMGKLGGSELNVSSDIDLIFAYKGAGQTDGEQTISNQDYFIKLGKKVIEILDEQTEDGFVFRVDMRLRPFGTEGVLASSLDALENYYQVNGREWERYAWIKGREITGGNQVSALLKPFVYRKYLDFNALNSLRDLKAQIQREMNVESSKVSGGVDNIKLGPGGIREIEFIAQVFQLIRGGRDVDLQIRPTLSVLDVLAKKKLMSKESVIALKEAYVFLRDLEHRLMYIEDTQTQDLPKQAASQAIIADAMQFESWDDCIAVLNHHRQVVRTHFEDIFSAEEESNSLKDAAIDQQFFDVAKTIWDGGMSDEAAVAALSNSGYLQAKDSLRQIRNLHQCHRYKQLTDQSRQRFDQLLPLLIAVALQVENPDIALMRTMDFIEAICRRASYLAMLVEFPNALTLVVKLCGASAWCSQYLTQHPIVLDELLDVETLYAAPDFKAMAAEISNKMLALSGDVEQQMNVMREFKHGAIFRFAAQDIAGELPLETLSDYLSDLADLILDVSLKTIWDALSFKHIEKPKFAVIGYGKLGGKEIGYASDLDIIFLYDDDSEDAGSIYARFAQRINNWFNTLTTAGLLYETDMELRPDGNSGLLVSSVRAFKDYQSNRAWVWEHQALSRARFAAGDTQIGRAFESIREEVLRKPKDTEKLRQEILGMRDKMRQSKRFHQDLFDLKHSQGGIIDVEFIVQYLVLLHAQQHHVLTANSGNIALLAALARLALIDKQLALAVGDAYREYRRLQHAARLQGEMEAKVERTRVLDYIEPVNTLWKQVFAD